MVPGIGPIEPVPPGVVRVGLLLPMSGDAEDLAADIQSAAEMALFDVGDNPVELLPRDAGSTPAEAAEAARAVLARGARVILGPVFSASVRGVAPLARAAGVPVLALSNNAAAAEPGVHVLGFRPEEQVARAVGYARGRGVVRLAGVGRDDALGRVAVRGLRRATAETGGELGPVVLYPPDQGDLSEPARRLLAGSPADAVLLAETGDRLRQLAASIVYTLTEPPEGGDAPAASPLPPATPRYLGLQAWLDDPAIAAEPSLGGAWLAGPDRAALDAFAGRFREAFGRPPADPVLAALGYDAAALAAVLARRPAADGGLGAYGPADLADPEGFLGASGVFRLRPDGLAEHGLAVYELTPQGVTAVEPAPARLPPPAPAPGSSLAGTLGGLFGDARPY